VWHITCLSDHTENKEKDKTTFAPSKTEGCMKKTSDDKAISVEVGTQKVSASISHGALSRLGQVAAWLFPRKDAKAKITSALADAVAHKIKTGSRLNEVEQYFVGRMFDREVQAVTISEQLSHQVQAVLPDVQACVGMP
jgi:hypothetical protein